MIKWATEIVAAGGEGVILRKCKSVYQSGRSMDVLKFKVSVIVHLVISAFDVLL